MNTFKGLTKYCMQSLKKASLYWIHLPEHTNCLAQGYIGVSLYPNRKWAEHLGKLLVKQHKNPHLIHAFAKYGWDTIVKEVLLIGEETYCYCVEETLRSAKNIGWNISIGGHRGPGWPKGRSPSKESIEKSRNTRLKKFEEVRAQRLILQNQVKIDRATAKRTKQQLITQAKIDKAAAKRTKQQLMSQAKETKRKTREEDRKLSRATNHILVTKKDGSLIKLPGLTHRPLCKTCNTPAAINYIKNNKTYFRSLCEPCMRRKKDMKLPVPSWVTAGYKKKPHCEKCGFKSKYKEQLFVYHTDGVLSNSRWTNLKTVCANCQIEITKTKLGWVQGDLIPDNT